MKVKNIILVFAALVGVVTASKFMYEQLILCALVLVFSFDAHVFALFIWTDTRAGCRSKNKNQCKSDPKCEWSQGPSGNMRCRRKTVTGSTPTGCRRKNKAQCLKARLQCQWRKVQSGKMRCRRKPDTGSGSETGPTESIQAKLQSRLTAGGVVDACICQKDHKTCVQATIQALQDFPHGGNTCQCYKLELVGGNPTMAMFTGENCVCKDPDQIQALPFFPFGGENCECFPTTW